jgi:hypothetical protein
MKRASGMYKELRAPVDSGFPLMSGKRRGKQKSRLPAPFLEPTGGSLNAIGLSDK